MDPPFRTKKHGPLGQWTPLSKEESRPGPLTWGRGGTRMELRDNRKCLQIPVWLVCVFCAFCRCHLMPLCQVSFCFESELRFSNLSFLIPR